MNILGLFMEGPNPAACLLVDGELVAMAEEERFNRIKKGGGSKPIGAIKYCLEVSELTIDDIDHIAIAWDHSKYPKWMHKYNKKHLKNRHKLDYFMEATHDQLHDEDLNKFQLKIGLSKAGIVPKGRFPPTTNVPHHEAHAWVSYLMSGFDETSILVIDGSGEEKCTTMWIGKDRLVGRVPLEFTIPNSIGWFYSCITEFLGFRGHSDEGKTMGLAPYGKENLWVRERLERIFKMKRNGDYEVDASYIYFGERTRSTRFTKKFMDMFGEPHIPGTPFTDLHKDLAYETQRMLEEVAKKLVKQLISKTGINNVCIAGGVGMNCKMNGVINQMPEVGEFFVFPAASDEGTAIGAALAICPEVKPWILEHTSYGPDFSNNEIKELLDELKLKYKYYKNIEKEVAKRVANDKIVGWFQGRMEFAARALGNRTILANPRNKDMKDIINDRVKHREPFRPFCPSILYEDKDKYLVDCVNAPFMIVAYEAQPGIKDLIPSVVHVDNTVRPQLVRKPIKPQYHQLISEFKKITGEGVVLNTSFNVRGEPIVCKPIEAIKCFYGTGMDAVAIGNYLLEK